MGFKQKRVVPGEDRTVGAVTNTLAQFDLSNNSSQVDFNNCAIFAQAYLVGRDIATGDSAGALSNAQFKRVTGTLLQVSTSLATVPIITSASLIGAALVVDATGTTIRLRATGVALLTIEWNCWLELYIV